MGVTEYICVGDENIYDFHVFTVRIWNEREKLHYCIQRSYSSFCEFQVKISKKFVRTRLPVVPLADFNRFLKRSERSKENTSSTGNGDSRLRRKDTSEVISQKKANLSSYLQDLLALPEVYMSEEFAVFLDEESPDGLILKFNECNDIDIDLLPAEPVSKTVARTHEAQVIAEEGHVVVWYSFDNEPYE